MKSRRAFTFVEAAVAMGLAAMLLAMALGFFTFGRRHGMVSATHSEFQRMGVFTVSHVMEHLLGAREVLVPVSGTERACCFQGWDGRYHLYAFDARRGVVVHRIVDVAQARVGKETVLARDVRTAQFSRKDGAASLSLRIVFARKRADSEREDLYPLETSLALRN